MPFLSATDLEQYTGYTQPAAQVRFLQKWRVHHVVNRLGRPVVTWDSVNRTNAATPERLPKEPNFAALNKAS